MRRFRALVLCFLICFGAFSCNQSQQQQGQYTYYYFPANNVYYSLQQNEYYYSLDGGATFSAFKPANGKIAPSLGDSIVMHTNALPVYMNNANDRVKYSAVVYNFPADTLDKMETAVERKVTSNNVATVKKEAVKPKKGIGGFLKKIFGKKNGK